MSRAVLLPSVVKKFISLSLIALATGCSRAYVPAPLGPGHPASASAPEAPPPPPSTALAGDAAANTPAEEARTGAHGGHHMHGGHE